MRGGICGCLLVLLVVVLPLDLVWGQTGTAQPERITSDQVAADFVRAASAALLPRETNQSPQLSPFQPLRPTAPWGPIGFPKIAKAAGIIFSGTITSVVRHPATLHQSIETVAITFHVEQAIRGATRGEELKISQWIGLWSSGQRYQVGERVLLFLYPPSKLGLTSCVSAPMGRFAVDPRGRILLTTQHLSAFRADPVLGGKSRVAFSDFAQAVRQASEAE